MRFDIEINLYGNDERMFIEYIYIFGKKNWKDQKNYKMLWGKRLGG